jgi:hypothetical protein
MTKVTNISTGPRGAYLKGVLVMAERGETIDADDYAPEWFRAGKVDDEPKPLAKMNKTELLVAAAEAGVETVTVDDKDVPVADATNPQLIAAIEAKRAAA